MMLEIRGGAAWQEPKDSLPERIRPSEKARFIVLQPIPDVHAAKLCEAQSNSTVSGLSGPH